VSVRGATTLSGRLVQAYGRPLAEPVHGLTHVFPRPEALADADVARIGMPKSRGETIRALSAAVRDGTLELTAARGLDDVVARLTALPGIGVWTAQYVAMRALREPDAFPAGDLGLQRAWGGAHGRASAKQLERASEAWRPWRAYAAVHLWTHESESLELELS
jgi:AraC family transcriptional regulator of adaptative response / DNA-3-methyladenine glycosylase II